MENNQPQQTILLHGSAYSVDQIEDNIGDNIEECRALTWNQQKWLKQPALVGPPNQYTQYIGQAFDPQTQTLVSDAWEHDHCEICSWELHETDDADHGVGYINDRNWVCTECYTAFIAPAINPLT